MPSPAEWIRSFLEEHRASVTSPVPSKGKQPRVSPNPAGELRPDFNVDVVRPEDLLNFKIAGFNLRAGGNKTQPKLERIHPDRDALLVITFPPQSINESATSEGDPEPAPGQPAPSASIVARLAGASRLVFRIPAHATMPAIPYTIEGLLNWSAFELVVAPLADIPPNPTPDQISSAPPIAAPSALETAIELPERLIFSPNHDVVWKHAIKPVTHASWTELWHTRLALQHRNGVIEISQKNPAPLRILWSPDYNAENPPLPGLDPELGKTALSPNDRYQIVLLNSAFHGFENEDNTPFVPSPINAEFLMLSPLGGWLRSRGSWNPPHSQGIGIIPVEKPHSLAGQVAAPDLIQTHVAEPISDSAPVAAMTAGNAIQLDVSEWAHIASQGRDAYVRVVYEGHLFPFGHRAAIVKVTERRFIDTGTTPVAYLIQYEYIVVREREKIYTQQPYQHGGREMPFQSIRLTTLVTPHIIDHLNPAVQINGTHASCWIVEKTNNQDVKFHAVATDLAGKHVEFTTSLIFADLQDLVDTPPASIPPGKIPGAFQNHYADIWQEYMMPENETRRVGPVAGQKVRFAARDEADKSKDNTTLTTSEIYFDTDPVAGLTSFGGFLPRLYKADVRVPAIEQLLGNEASTTICLFPDYLQNDIDQHAGVFALIVKEDISVANPESRLQADTLPINFTADKAGGLATPNLALSCLTRIQGPMAGSPQKASQGLFDASEFFGNTKIELPTLFGSLKLVDIMPSGDLPADANAPKLQFKTGTNPDGSKKLITSLDWTPQVHESNGGMLTFSPTADTKFEVHAKLEKPLGTGAQQASSRFNGKLTKFHLDFLEVIRINVQSFSFDSRNGSKPQVKVDMDKNEPVAFEGDLTFVNELRKVIPKGAFGGGLSIDLTREPGIHVGYGIGLPSITVGVFELSHIRLSTGLDLSFISGTPRFDFGFCERYHPFLLRVYIFGGGGFFHLQLDTAGIRMLEAGLEFGAVVDLDFDVASGGVHIMAGIYFTMQFKKVNGQDANVASLTGYLRAGGELSVLGIISISIEFVLSFTYVFQTGKATGRATLTIHVSVLFLSISVSLTVEKSFGGSGGDPTFQQMIDSPSIWNEYALAFA